MITNEYSAMAVVICQNKILTTTEDIFGKITLSLPKGHLEGEETPLQTAMRECLEETGIPLHEANFVKLLPTYSYEFSTPSGKKVNKTIYPVLFKVDGFINANATEERILSVQWMDLQQFVEQSTHQNVAQVVKQLL